MPSFARPDSRGRLSPHELLLIQNPACNLVEHDRRHRLFDPGVLGGGASFRRLEQVIQAGKFIDFEVFVASLFEGFANHGEILAG